MWRSLGLGMGSRRPMTRGRSPPMSSYDLSGGSSSRTWTRSSWSGGRISNGVGTCHDMDGSGAFNFLGGGILVVDLTCCLGRVVDHLIA